MPQLSVLMPVRDGAPWIAESIDSVLAQTFADFELLIVDDGSRDATPAVVADYAARDPRIVAIVQPATGLVAALNRGLAAARAPLLARLDADDIAEPTRLEEQVVAMMRDPHLAVLGSWATDIDENGRAVGHRRPATNTDTLVRHLADGNPMIHSAVMLRTAMVRAAGGYRAAFAAAEDYDLWLRLSERGSMGNLPRELVRYRVHAGSVTARKALLQMLSTRLARRSAELRQAGQPDPAELLAEPLDLWREPPQAYANDVAIFRALAWADPQTLPIRAGDSVPDFEPLTRTALTRRERRVAQDAILNFMSETPTASRAALWAHLIALRPLRGVALVWQALHGNRKLVAA